MVRLPNRVGLSLHPQHYEEISSIRPDIGWLEVKAEQFLGQGGKHHYYLEQISTDYPIAMNSRSLSIGSAESLDRTYLKAIKDLVDRYHPAQFSEQLGWTRWQGDYFHELLPTPYTEETLDHIAINIKELQNTLGRSILLENPSTLIHLEDSEFSEGEFFSELVRNTGCGLLLDINSLYTSCQNKGKDPYKELAEYPIAAIKEIHLGGHSLLPTGEQDMLLVNDNSCDISKPVWQLFRQVLTMMPSPVATLIEWDVNVPPLPTLHELTRKAEDILFAPPQPIEK